MKNKARVDKYQKNVQLKAKKKKMDQVCNMRSMCSSLEPTPKHETSDEENLINSCKL